jgi:hypothetical protein
MEDLGISDRETLQDKERERDEFPSRDPSVRDHNQKNEDDDDTFDESEEDTIEDENTTEDDS